MDTQYIGLLGATSLLGECLLRQLVRESWHITAFSRHPVPQTHPNIRWQQLGISGQVNENLGMHNISTWLCVAPIWVLPEYFGLLSAYGAQRIVVLSSTSRFTKEASSNFSEREIALQLIKGEELVQAWAEAHGIAWIILRPTLIYGYGRDKNVAEIAKFIRRFGFFPVLGSANGLRQPVHVEDVASACCSAISALNLTNRSYNLTGGETLHYREMVKRVFVALNRRPRIFTIPLWLFQMATWGLRWLPSYQSWTAAMAERMNQDLRFDCSDAKQDLNFFPRSFSLAQEDLPRKTD